MRRLALPLFSILACSAEPSPSPADATSAPPADVGFANDIATADDVGAADGGAVDAAPEDAGRTEDARADAAPAPDGGASTDAGVMADAGGLADAGMRPDPNPNPAGLGAIHGPVDGVFTNVQPGLTLGRLAFTPGGRIGYYLRDNQTPAVSMDRGATWPAQRPFFGPERALSFVSDNPIAGYGLRNARVVKWNGGGWGQVHLDTATLNDVAFPAGEERGVVVADGGRVLRTENGGTSWTSEIVPSGSAPAAWRRVSCAPVQGLSGMIAGGVGVYATGDGGATWRIRTATAASHVVMIDERTAYYAIQNRPSDGRASVYKTVDGGARWVEVLRASLGGFNQAITDLHSPPGHPGVVFVGTQDGAQGGLLKTTDGGLNWTWIRVIGATGSPVSSVWFFDDREGFVASTRGLLRTQSGGT